MIFKLSDKIVIKRKLAVVYYKKPQPNYPFNKSKFFPAVKIMLFCITHL